MKKLFVSQPMNGKSSDEILKERKYLIAMAETYPGETLEVLDTFFEDAPADAKPLWYLGESLKNLASADLAVFARDWACARGCRIEHAAAEEYGIPMMEV
uniref:hypothetical protein n=1 Tax=Gemmiger formicilis TaxID=745368 RepID=UPI003FED45E2